MSTTDMAVTMKPRQTRIHTSPGFLARWMPARTSGRRDMLPLGSRVGELTVRSFLGEGGFGYAYSAVDADKEVYALKECFPRTLCRRAGAEVGLKSASNEERVTAIQAQFRLEAEALSAMDNPHIVRGGELIEANGTCYLVMSFVKGRHLSRMRRSLLGVWSEAAYLAIAHELLDALQHVHQRGYLHNDLSPENVLVTAKRKPVLIDFGTCAPRGEAEPQNAADDLLVVKPGYSPPEFYLSTVEKTEQSDIYQLGATLITMITREIPPEALQRMTQTARGGRDPMPELPEPRRKAFARLLESLEKATALRAADRFGSVTEWRDSLAK